MRNRIDAAEPRDRDRLRNRPFVRVIAQHDEVRRPGRLYPARPVEDNALRAAESEAGDCDVELRTRLRQERRLAGRWLRAVHRTLILECPQGTYLRVSTGHLP